MLLQNIPQGSPWFPQPNLRFPQAKKAPNFREASRVNQTVCKICSIPKDEDEFNTIICEGQSGCNICSKCRTRNNRQCPLCEKDYSLYKIDLIGVLKFSY